MYRHVKLDVTVYRGVLPFRTECMYVKRDRWLYVKNVTVWTQIFREDYLR